MKVVELHSTSLHCVRTTGHGSAATLDDIREAVTTLEDVERIARRVLGGTHPLTSAIEGDLAESRAVAGVVKDTGASVVSARRLVHELVNE